jgi:hypothetical protein
VPRQLWQVHRFVRSYAALTRQTDQSDVVLSYVGVIKAV